ncbi:polysaccharide biosynthesis tyrosine autokinase [Chryseobacterium sp. POL2]|uniref:GumC family protein n=1 Tax=Chryseobacterium sp. POL2 TaxID=2713414 RepID=UPI0013E1022D|nr:tyrosine-protein kinase [Chryseobacterium sp. POL2]QIG90337.1 polysaccharide biosynthesis tyrosine autokinase [Chryseobacterium sp. POL2]
MELLDTQTKQTKHRLDLEKEFRKALKFWPLFIVLPLLFYAGAKIYMRYAQPQYFSKTTLKFEQASPKPSTQALNDLKNLGVGFSNDELDAETVVMVSKPILGKVVKNLNLNVKYYSVGKIKEVEYYDELPIRAEVVSLKNPDQFGGASFILDSGTGNSFSLSSVDGSHLKTYQFGSLVDLGFGSVIFEKQPISQAVHHIKVVFTNPKYVVSGLEGALNVRIYKSLLMDINMVSPTYKKSEAILAELVKVYNDEGIKDKNQESQFTADFIDRRLQIITDELAGIENQKEGVKRDYQITDLATQAQLALTNVNANTKEVLGYATQLDLVSSVYQLANAGGQSLLPTGLGLSGAIDAQISQYNDLVLTRNRVLKQATNANPAVIEMNKQIGILKDAIRGNLADVRRSLQDNISRLQGDINQDKGKIDRYPTQEKVFRSIDRQQNLKEALYLFLLQKREENAINLAVALPKAKVINPPYTSGVVAPKGQLIIWGSTLLGFVLALGFVVVRGLMDTKVYSKADILNLVDNATLIGEIPESKADAVLVGANDFSMFAESFRILSSNLKYILKTRKTTDDAAVILVTSSVKGEGKTTLSMNLAMSLAGSSKVLIIGADIRNPQLHRFVPRQKLGLTDYLISNDAQADAYIFSSGLSEHLDVMFSGAKAPNPNDLLDMAKFDEMIDTLKVHYQYIILDSAPVMLVSDTIHLVDLSDVILYVAKAGYTEKSMMHFADDFRKEHHIDKLSFVLNSVKPEFSRYGNKYGYGYYHVESKKAFFKK